MTKRKIISHDNQKCVCRHERIYHDGISGTCHHTNCVCVKFRLKDVKREDKHVKGTKKYKPRKTK